jgi:hypothetical protein
LRASALAIVAPRAHVVERRDKAFGERDVGSLTLRIESLGWHQQRPREALDRLLVVVSAALKGTINRVAPQGASR